MGSGIRSLKKPTCAPFITTLGCAAWFSLFFLFVVVASQRLMVGLRLFLQACLREKGTDTTSGMKSQPQEGVLKVFFKWYRDYK